MTYDPNDRTRFIQDYDSVFRHVLLLRAAIAGDWKKAEDILNNDPDPNADSAVITYWNETTLHMAVAANSSHEFVNNLVERIAAKDITKLWAREFMCNNPLHFAAKVGNTKAAIKLVDKDHRMTLMPNEFGFTPVRLAASHGHKETLEYLISVTPDEMGEYRIKNSYYKTSPYSGVAGGDLITLTVTAGFYDVALTLIKRYPNLATENDWKDSTALQTLSTQPTTFPSGQSWWFWTHFIYFCIPLNNPAVNNNANKQLTSDHRKKRRLDLWFRDACFRFYTIIWRIAQYLVPYLKRIHDKKLEHKQTEQLLKAIISTTINTGNRTLMWNVLAGAMHTALNHGTLEIIEECLKAHPSLVWRKTHEEWNILQAAIKDRQVKIYNLIYQLTGVVNFVTAHINFGNNALHLVGMKASPHRLNTVTGAALQMQRELQWYKEVEKLVDPSFREALNSDKKTPQMLFTDEHKDLLEKGEKWMRDTASSSMVVAALIVTVTFAAIFHAPGGDNEGKGTPYFLKDSAFMVFAISDAVALFSSVTSVLMFSAVLTSRYSEDDFLYALPKRITIGLVALFISIAGIMVTFCAALDLLLRETLAWIVIPVSLIAGVPVTFFALLHFPLLVELCISTYGPSIFHKQSNLILH